MQGQKTRFKSDMVFFPLVGISERSLAPATIVARRVGCVQLSFAAAEITRYGHIIVTHLETEKGGKKPFVIFWLDGKGRSLPARNLESLLPKSETSTPSRVPVC